VSPETQYMGKPCKRGHEGLRWKSNRGCVECGREWRRRKLQNDPVFRDRQREYMRAYLREHYLAHREAYIERAIEWNRKNWHKRRGDPDFRRKQAIYMMFYHANKKRERYGNAGYTLGNDDQEGRRGRDWTAA
jgi:hypothetical protein